MDETFEERLAAVERAVTEGDQDLAALAETANVTDRLEDAESDLETLSDRVAELEAATQALRGYVGNVRSVNRDVERRADAALSAVQSADLVSPGDESGTRCGADTCPHCGTEIGETDHDPSDREESSQDSSDQTCETGSRIDRPGGTPGFQTDGIRDEAHTTLESALEGGGDTSEEAEGQSEFRVGDESTSGILSRLGEYF